ncbi:MAG TPA: hypothetical protein VJ552_06255 [Sediminibacterium sp.]|nr:hypothetical protein [Sediminibacterium sp.]
MLGKKILYTISSASHLAYCKTMADSFITANPDYQVMICLADQIMERFDPAGFAPHQLITVEAMNIPAFAAMSERYDIVELSCALKPFAGLYILEKFRPDCMVYLDSDIQVYDSFLLLEEELNCHSIIVTPHFSKPLPADSSVPRERDILRHGLYNGGFFMLKNDPIAISFLTWWGSHLEKEGYLNYAEGMGRDQNWLNFLPLFFSNVLVAKEMAGVNVAYWNLHERSVSRVNNRYMVNDTSPLVFFHISGYSFDQPELLSKHQDRYDLDQFPLLKGMLHQYRQAVLANDHARFSAMECAYARKKKKSMGIMKTINRMIRPLGIKVSDI